MLRHFHDHIWSTTEAERTRRAGDVTSADIGDGERIMAELDWRYQTGRRCKLIRGQIALLGDRYRDSDVQGNVGEARTQVIERYVVGDQALSS
ncbi:hypothetical protein TNCV_690431 [Trichonephila clavipes]|nr:hypothetical protein TNCV_690431 [Trichonephila clavipes]